MPIVFITYSLAYVDRSNFSFASAAGINDDLGITKGMSSLLGALFFLGYFFFQIPGTIYAERRSVKKLIFWCLLLWGGFASLTGVVNNIPMLAVIRFALGVVEAAVMPAMLVYISNWFTKSERSRANTFLILGNPVTVLWMSVLSGYLIHAFGWREMFIFEGIPAVIWAFCWWFLVKDKPEQVGWLTQDEKQALAAQLAKEQEGIKAVHNYAEAFKSRNVILLCMQYFAWSIGVYGFVLWLPSILRSGMQMGMVEAGWLSSVPYLAATIAMIVVSWASDKMQNRKIFVWPLLLIGALAFFASWAIGPNNFWISYSLLVVAAAAMYAPYGPFFAIIPEMLPKNVAGGAMALINSLGALGSFFGSWFVGYLNGNTGSPAASFIFMAVSLLVSVILTLMVKPERDAAKPQSA
ncbi:Inner membrane transport protein RhmT [Ewingella americana]|nr:Inner membrane transport protein RhmT [Ewingella americana]